MFVLPDISELSSLLLLIVCSSTQWKDLRERLATQNFWAGCFSSGINVLITKGFCAPLSVNIYYGQFL